MAKQHTVKLSNEQIVDIVNGLEREVQAWLGIAQMCAKASTLYDNVKGVDMVDVRGYKARKKAEAISARAHADYAAKTRDHIALLLSPTPDD